MQKITIRAIGKLQESWHQQAIHMYLQRLRPYAQVEIVELAEGHQESAKPNIEKTRKIEGQQLLKGLTKNALIILLDENGKEFTSTQFAEQLNLGADSSQSIVFLIGGS